MKYLLQDGSGVVEAATPAQLINQLKDTRFTAEQTADEYMAGFASRFKEFHGGESPRTDTPEHFVADLIAQGWLKEVPE